MWSDKGAKGEREKMVLTTFLLLLIATGSGWPSRRSESWFLQIKKPYPRILRLPIKTPGSRNDTPW